jgi:hypothetical protein
MIIVLIIIIVVSTIIYCNYIMRLFGISLPNLFGKSVKHSSHKRRRSGSKTHHKTHHKKHSSKKRRNKSRRYKMRGG